MCMPFLTAVHNEKAELSQFMETLAKEFPLLRCSLETQNVFRISIGLKTSAYQKDTYSKITTLIKEHNKNHIIHFLSRPRDHDEYVSCGPINNTKSKGSSGKVERVFRRSDVNKTTPLARKHFLNKGKELKHLLMEAQNVIENSLEHYSGSKNCLKFVDAYWTNNNNKPEYFLVLNDCGTPLSELLLQTLKKEVGCKTLKDYVVIILGLCSNVSLIHQISGCGHGDLKPNNCTVRDDLSACVIDFGGISPFRTTGRLDNKRMDGPKYAHDRSHAGDGHVRVRSHDEGVY
ncbi:hypothetical protein AKO1_003648 [Acrasis kona]|uniref:Protein kinase domain-containing protein n=1 Tax=Acrasis kona TaxID=1008807 RepID=A0AAW2Z862_9EUKA